MLGVRLAGVRKVLRPQGAARKLVVRAHLVRVEVSLVLLQIAQESKFFLTHRTHEDIADAVKQKAVFRQIAFRLKELHAEFTFEGPFFGMNREMFG